MMSLCECKHISYKIYVKKVKHRRTLLCQRSNMYVNDTVPVRRRRVFSSLRFRFSTLDSDHVSIAQWLRVDFTSYSQIVYTHNSFYSVVCTYLMYIYIYIHTVFILRSAIVQRARRLGSILIVKPCCVLRARSVSYFFVHILARSSVNRSVIKYVDTRLLVYL